MEAFERRLDIFWRGRPHLRDLRAKNRKRNHPYHSTGEHEPYIKSGETRSRLEEEVEFLVPSSNGYPC